MYQVSIELSDLFVHMHIRVRGYGHISLFLSVICHRNAPLTSFSFSTTSTDLGSNSEF